MPRARLGSMRRFRWGTAVALASGVTSTLAARHAALAVQADPAATTVHVVQPGETLSQIALDAGVDAASLAALNGLDDLNFLVAGQSLKVPASPGGTAAPVAQAPSAPAPQSYTVGEGDTLWAISQRFGTTTDALVQLNKLDEPNHLALGTVLSLPAGSSVASPPPTAAPASASPAPSSPT